MDVSGAIVLAGPIARSTGESLLAGVLFSPLLFAIPFFIAGCGLFPHSWVLPHGAKLLYNRAPVIDGVNMQSNLCLLGFWGFGMPAVQRWVRLRWLQWLIVLPIGILFFAYEESVVSGPLVAPLTAGDDAGVVLVSVEAI